MLTKNQKIELVKELSEKIKVARSTVFVDYKGLKVKEATELKKLMKKEGVEYMVIRKTLLDLALEKAGIKGISAKKMEGQIALSISKTDEVSGAKIIDNFAKLNERPKMLGGILGEQILNETEVKALARIPSKAELLAKFAQMLNVPARGLVNVLAGNLRGFIQALNAVKEQKT